MVTQMFNRQISLEAELVATKQELSKTLEKLKIGKKYLLQLNLRLICIHEESVSARHRCTFCIRAGSDAIC